MNDFHSRHRSRSPRPEELLSDILTIGELSRIYTVTLRAIRFYEQRGLLKPIRRGRLRFYDSTQRERLQSILKGKNLGFTLVEIAELLDAGPDDGKRHVELILDERLLLSQLRHLEKRRSDLDLAIEELRTAHKQILDQRQPNHPIRVEEGGRGERKPVLATVAQTRPASRRRRSPG